MSSTLSPNGTYIAALGWNDFSGYAHDHQPARPTDDRLTGHRPGRPRERPRTTSRSRPTARCSRPTARRSGCHSRPYLTALHASIRRPARRRRRLRSRSAARRSTSPSLRPEHRPEQRQRRLAAFGHGATPRTGSKLYVALNGANTLGVIDTATDHARPELEIPVGNAPRQVVISPRRHDRLRLQRGWPPGQARRVHQPVRWHADRVEQVDRRGDHRDCLGGQPDDRRGDAGDPGRAAADRALSGRHGAVRRQLQRRQPVGDRRARQSGHADGRHQPDPRARVGSYANAISMVGHTVLVSIGRDNAIAVYRYRGLYRPMTLRGLLPTDWYPVQVQPDPAARRRRRSSSPTTRASAPRARRRRSTRARTRSARAPPATTPTTTPEA